MAIGLLIALILLIMISAFFSGSETAMMALNRYRIRHLAQKGHRHAKQTQKLLEKPERLLGIILIGNTFANIIASALATLLAHKLYGDAGVAVMTILLTLIILLFAEILPKTLAAYYPRKLAFSAVWPLTILLKVFYPLVWLLSSTAKGILRCFGMQLKRQTDALNHEELKSLVNASQSQIPGQKMLLGVLDLEHATIADCMVHKRDIHAINFHDAWEEVTNQILQCPYSRVIVYHKEFSDILGVLPIKKALKLLLNPQKNPHEQLRQILEKPFYIPEFTTLTHQLRTFQTQNQRFGIVVDEYGDFTGIVTAEDIIEEVMGEFTEPEQQSVNDLTKAQTDGSHLVQGVMTIRDVNRDLGYDFPTDGPKTLSGLIIEHIEALPTVNTTVMIHRHPIEIVKVSGQSIEQARIFPQQPQAEKKY